MAEGELPAPGEKEDNFNSSLNSQQTTETTGASSDGNLPWSTTEEEGDQFEGTTKSNGSKEYSFGTTVPPKLPKAHELEELACTRGTVENISKAVNGSGRDKTGLPPKLPKAQSQDLDELACASTQWKVVDSTSSVGNMASIDKDWQETNTKRQPSELLYPPEASTPTFALHDEATLRVRSDSKEDGRLSPSSENEAFTFGTTNPLVLPDPALLRQAANTDKHVEPKIEERAIVPVPPAAATVRPTSASAREQIRPQQFQPSSEQLHPHVPLPPILEPHPMPPMLPPDEAVGLRSMMLSSASVRSFQGELACYASPPPHQMMMQAPFVPHQMYPGVSPTPQPWNQPVCFPAQHFSLPYAAEVSASPEEFALHPAVEQIDQDDYGVLSRRGSLTVNHDATDPYGYSDDQAALKTSDFDNESSMEKITSVFISSRRNRILAAGSIVLLVVMAGGCVVFLVK